MNSKEQIKKYFEETAHRRPFWKKRNRFYHRALERYFSLIIPPGARVLELGCGTGELLASVKPAYGMGIDFSEEMIRMASEKYPNFTFVQGDMEAMDLVRIEPLVPFDYIILSDVMHILWDVQITLQQLHKFCHPGTRLVISNYNFIWEPLLKFSEKIRLKQPTPNSNWLTPHDIFNLLEIEGFSAITNYRKLLLPKYVPVLNLIFNRFLVNLPLLNALGIVNFIIARPLAPERRHYSVSIVIPARNEKGNIESAIVRTPAFGKTQEYIFVEGHSSDGTFDEMIRVQNKYTDKTIRVLQQTGKGKGNAVREGFEAANGEILMILDADLTAPPEELPKFYDALVLGRGEFINGCRLVYPMEKEAMRS